MILVGFVLFLALGIAIIIWLDMEFYFKRRVKADTTVFNALVSFAKDRKYYLLLALVFLVAGIIFGLL